MDIVRADDADDLGRRAARIVMATLARAPDATLVFPVGATPRGLFARLIGEHRAGRLDASRARVVLLDEYAGITRDDRRSFAAWLRRDLLQPLDITADRLLAFAPNGDRDIEGSRIEAGIAAWGGIDLAVLGIGLNGHLGFNEPGSPADSRARRVALAPETIASNARYWGRAEDVPPHGFTLGLGTLSAARRVVVLASGPAKRSIVQRLLADVPSPDLPASVAHRHPAATLIVDPDAAPPG